jgi:DnaA family protein
MQQLPLGVQLEVSSRFETFRAGSNIQAIEELCTLKRVPGQPPLWLCGPSGSGKTHLLQASCFRLGDRGASASYLPLAQCAAMGAGLLAGCEQLDAVLIDDLEQVAGDPQWESALFTLHNELQEHGGRLVLASREPPGKLRWRLADLASRLGAASVHRLRPLPEPEQAEALLARAAARGLELPQETLLYLLRHAPRDFGALCRLLDALDRASLASQRRLTVPLVREVLEHAGGSSVPGGQDTQAHDQ